MKVGIIDIGSNTINLLIANVRQDGAYQQLHQSKIGVKLVESGFERNYITERAMERAMVALEAHINHIKNEYCDRMLAFGSATLRNATNSQEFIDKVHARLQLQIRIIEEEHEANLIYEGVKLSGAINNSKSLIMDIGGGSTEFILCDNKEVLWKGSYELGVTRLYEKLEPNDPITPQQLEYTKKYLVETMGEVFEVVKKERVDTLIGSSGSFDTFSEVLSYRTGTYENDIVQSSLSFDIPMLLALLSELESTTISHRRSLRGMDPIRANIIGMSAIFVKLVQERCNFKKIVLSRYSLKEGVLYDVLKRG